MTMQNDPSDLDTATSALRSREPIFHRPEFGTSRSDFDAMMADDFREVGASGSKYSRDYVLDVLEERHGREVVEDLVVADFECRQLAANLFLATYLLDQSGRLSRRATVWQWDDGRWSIRYHQGTLVVA